MERSRADDDDTESSTNGTPSTPTESPWAKLMGVRGEAMFAVPPKVEAPDAPPPPPVLSPTILRIEQAPPPPPPREVLSPQYYPAEAVKAAELDEDDDTTEKSEDDDDAPVAVPAVKLPETSQDNLDAEWQSVPVPESHAPQPPGQEYTPPLPVYEVDYAQPADARAEEPWTPPVAPVSRPQAPSQPAEFAFFDRRTDIAETPPVAPPPPPQEAVWQHPQYYQPEATAPAAPAAPTQEQSPHQYYNYSPAEVRRMHNVRASELIVPIVLAGWFNHKLNKQHHQQERAINDLHQEHAQQAQENYNLQHQVAAQGQRLEQLSQAPQFARSEQQPVVTPEQAQQLRQQAIAAEQVAAEQAVNPNGLQPGQRIEHSWYNEVVGADGKVIEGAVEHGRAYHEERQAESAGYRFTQQKPASVSSTVYDDSATVAFPLPAPADPRLASGQVDSGHGLPSGQVDFDHLLDERKPFKNVTSNPWIWVGLAVLLFAFFGAAFL